MSHEADVARTVEALKQIIRLKGYPLREVDRRLSRHRGWTGKNLGDSRDLKYRELLELLDALEVSPDTFFASLFPLPGYPSRPLADPARRASPPEPQAMPSSTADPYVRRSELMDLFRELLAEATAGRGEP